MKLWDDEMTVFHSKRYGLWGADPSAVSWAGQPEVVGVWSSAQAARRATCVEPRALRRGSAHQGWGACDCLVVAGRGQWKEGKSVERISSAHTGAAAASGPAGGEEGWDWSGAAVPAQVKRSGYGRFIH